MATHRLRQLRGDELAQTYKVALAEIRGQRKHSSQPVPEGELPVWAVELTAETTRLAIIAFCDANGLQYPGPR